MPWQGVHVMASSWPATAYMLQHKHVPALLRKPLVTNIARSMGKHPAQVCPAPLLYSVKTC